MQGSTVSAYRASEFTSEFGFSTLFLLLQFFPPQLDHLQLKFGFPRQEVFNSDHRSLERHLSNTQILMLSCIPESKNIQILPQT